jgi:hypothetical protein
MYTPPRRAISIRSWRVALSLDSLPTDDGRRARGGARSSSQLTKAEPLERITARPHRRVTPKVRKRNATRGDRSLPGGSNADFSLLVSRIASARAYSTVTRTRGKSGRYYGGRLHWHTAVLSLTDHTQTAAAGRGDTPASFSIQAARMFSCSALSCTDLVGTPAGGISSGALRGDAPSDALGRGISGGPRTVSCIASGVGGRSGQAAASGRAALRVGTAVAALLEVVQPCIGALRCVGATTTAVAPRPLPASNCRRRTTRGRCGCSPATRFGTRVHAC